LHGGAFDKAYIDQAVLLHQDVLDIIDNQLMPNTTNEDLKTLLYDLFLPLSDHLEHAQEIQEALTKKRPVAAELQATHYQLRGRASPETQAHSAYFAQPRPVRKQPYIAVGRALPAGCAGGMRDRTPAQQLDGWRL
jgi:hypothetical protein